MKQRTIIALAMVSLLMVIAMPISSKTLTSQNGNINIDTTSISNYSLFQFSSRGVFHILTFYEEGFIGYPLNYFRLLVDQAGYAYFAPLLFVFVRNKDNDGEKIVTHEAYYFQEEIFTKDYYKSMIFLGFPHLGGYDGITYFHVGLALVIGS